MSEWWTYSLSDFLLFSAKTYYRLFELYNREIWPAQLVALMLGVLILAALAGQAPWRRKAVAAILAACWLWIAWAFHAERYAAINWAASYFAIGFAAEALLLLWAGMARAEPECNPAGGALRIAGICLFIFALGVQPLIGPMIGRPWPQAEVFGIAPDPTVAATLGILLSTVRRPLWPQLIIPVIWCAVSGATLWSMGSRDALLMPLIGLAALLLTIWKALSPRTG